jgi:hypothetical protein
MTTEWNVYRLGRLTKVEKKTENITERKKIHACGTGKHAIRNKNGKKTICKRTREGH